LLQRGEGRADVSANASFALSAIDHAAALIETTSLQPAEIGGAMTLIDVLLQEAEQTYDITKKLFRHVADGELSWKPTTGKSWMTVGQLLMHCASFGCGKAVRGFVKGDWGLPKDTRLEDLGDEQHVPPPEALPSVESVKQALELLAEDRNLAIVCLAQVHETRLLTETFAAPWGGSELSLFQHLLSVIAHLAQHKGQLFYYLKLMGRDVNTGDLWGA
jgi:uncharacterized damage-inducible protein DinB